MSTRAIDTLSRLELPPEDQWSDALGHAIQDGWLPFPLSELLRGVVEQRASSASFLVCSTWLFEATYRLVAALVVPPLVKNGSLSGDLARLLAAITGASSGGARDRLSLGGWKDLALTAIVHAAASPEVLRRLPPFIHEWALRAGELEDFHRAGVELRNGAVGHGRADGRAPDLLGDEARAMERAVVRLVHDLFALRDYELLLPEPACIVTATGALAPGGFSLHAAKPHEVFLGRVGPFGALMGTWPLSPLVCARVEGEAARVYFADPPQAGRLLLLPALDGAAPVEAQGAQVAALRSLAEILERRLEAPGARRPSIWAADLNQHFGAHARVLGPVHGQPELWPHGAYEASEAVSEAASAKRATLRANDLHGILTEEPGVEATPLTLFYETLDFATVQALRDGGERPRLLSASAVVLHRDEPKLLLHERSRVSATYPGALHTIGGAFEPRGELRAGDPTLVHTVLRELTEESSLWPVPEEWPSFLTEETPTGFVQYVVLGVRVKPSTPTDTWEGRGRWVAFDALEPLLLRAKGWVPSGKLHVLLWLAAGAPGAAAPRFRGRTPEELLTHVLSHSARDYDLPKIQS